MFKMSEYSFVAGLIAVLLSVACYAVAFILARLSSRSRVQLATAGAAASGGSAQVSPGRSAWASSLATYGTLIAWLAFAFITASLVFRTIHTGHGPFANMYEFSIAFAWGVLGAYVYFERKYHLRTLGLIALPIAAAMLFYATTIPSTAEPLVPALQNSLLLTVHVAMAIVAYGTFTVAFGAACLYLVQQSLTDRILAAAFVGGSVVGVVSVIRAFDFVAVVIGILAAAFITGGLTAAWTLFRPITDGDARVKGLPRPELLDEISYRAVIVGYPFLTLTIVLGALWADQAWGRYWGWDPKETASLVTWFIYGAYLHARVVRGWHGRRAAILLLVGFAATLFTYFGNLFFGGLHSYSGLGD